MDYKIIWYITIGIVAFLILRRIVVNWAINKLVRTEFEHVLNNDEFKVKGRFQ